MLGGDSHGFGIVLGPGSTKMSEIQFCSAGVHSLLGEHTCMGALEGFVRIRAMSLLERGEGFLAGGLHAGIKGGQRKNTAQQMPVGEWWEGDGGASQGQTAADPECCAERFEL